MTSSTFIPASQKQIDFLVDLFATRVCEAEFREIHSDLIMKDRLTKAQASAAIDVLVNAPRNKAATAVSPLQKLLADIPKSKYAVSSEELMLSDYEDSFSVDIIFLELKEFNGVRYVRRLHGAPGGFTRVKLKADEVEFLFKIIAKDPYKHARLFGEHYSCCGSCGADLTDARSRELQLGPECRKKFGL